VQAALPLSLLGEKCGSRARCLTGRNRNHDRQHALHKAAVTELASRLWDLWALPPQKAAAITVFHMPVI
jgi:hypothetical protein